MDAAPAALRPYVLVTTAFVVMGTAAGFLLWYVARDAATEARPFADPEADTRPVDFGPSASPAQRERLAWLVGKLQDPNVGMEQAGVVAELVATAEMAVPPLLTAMHAIASDPARAEDHAEQMRFREVDRVLSRIRGTVTPSDPAGPLSDAPDAGWVRRRARTWFAWWERASPLVWR